MGKAQEKQAQYYNVRKRELEVKMGDFIGRKE